MIESRRYVVVGGGCSGLTFALELAGCMRPDDELIVLEERETYDNDRTWCFFDVAFHTFDEQIEHRWSRCLVRDAQDEVAFDVKGFEYCRIPGKAFYDAALLRLSRDDRVTVRLGAMVDEIIPSTFGVDILIGAETLYADTAFDARNPYSSRYPVRTKRPQLIQHFLGQTVQVDSPVFDPQTAVLMDFDAPQDLDLHFLYLLPFDERTALVEPTFIGKSPAAPDAYRRRISEHLRKRYDISSYAVLEEESGSIPMDSSPINRRPHQRLFLLGTGAGLIKASSGYGFLTIQRISRVLADFVVRETPGQPPCPRPRTASMLDAVFLSFLEHRPEQAPAAFVNLFRKTPAERLARFLFDVPQQGDCRAVIRAAPAGAMITEALRTLPRLLRQ